MEDGGNREGFLYFVLYAIKFKKGFLLSTPNALTTTRHSLPSSGHSLSNGSQSLRLLLDQAPVRH